MACSAVLFLGRESNEFSGKSKEVVHTMEMFLCSRGDPNNSVAQQVARREA